MYEPRVDALKRRFKGRHAAPMPILIPRALGADHVGWTTFTPMAVFCTPPRVVPRIFTYFKKALRYPKATSRFWVSAQCAHLVTRKPLNVRMGKGKGARVRRYSKGHGGAPLAAVSVMRAGVRTRVRRFMATRLGCPVIVVGPDPALASLALWVRQWRAQAAVIRDRAIEIRGLIKLARRPSTKVFFAKLFGLAWRRPRLRWRRRWPLLPRKVGLNHGRELRPGSGFRPIAVLWAGASSVANGVRRIRRTKLRSLPRPGLRDLRTWVLRACYRCQKPSLGKWFSALSAPLAAFARAARAPALPPARICGAGLGPSPRALRALVRGWDIIGASLPRLSRALRAG
jgi:hypothetical protein